MTAWRYWNWDPVERPRLHRPAGHDDLGGAVEAAAVDAGGALRRRAVSSPERRRRRLRVPARRSTRIRRSSRSRDRRRRAFCWRRARPRRRPACSTATASISTSSSATSAPRRSASSNGRSPIACACCRACASTTTTRRWTSISTVYGGLQTTDPALIALQALGAGAAGVHGGCRRHQHLGPADGRVQGLAERQRLRRPMRPASSRSASTSNGVPTDALGNPVLSAATVKPEDVRHVEVGVKTEPFPGVTANVTVFNTDIKDYQAQVVNAQVGVLRGYLANAEKVRVRGAEFDGNARIGRRLSFYGAVAYTDGIYVSFPDAPPPLEDTGGPQVKDISGSVLPGISKWALSFGGEYSKPATVVRPGRRVLSAQSTPAIGRSSRRARPLRGIWSWTATACSTRGSVSGGATAGRCSSGRATCWTRSTSSSSRRSPATPGSTSGCRRSANVGVTLRMNLRRKRGASRTGPDDRGPPASTITDFLFRNSSGHSEAHPLPCPRRALMEPFYLGRGHVFQHLAA